MRKSNMKQDVENTISRPMTRLNRHLLGATWTLILMALIQVFAFIPFVAFAKSTTVRKVQEVNFAEMDLKGTVRNPDGAYLVQKRGIKFMPLYDMQKSMDTKIRDSIVYAK